MKWDRRKRMSRHRRGIAGHTSAGVRTGFQDLACTSCLLFTREKYTQMQASSSFPIQLWAKYLPPRISLPPFLLFLQSHIKNMNLQLGKEKCHWLKALPFFSFGIWQAWDIAQGFVCLTFCLLCRTSVASCRMWFGWRCVGVLLFFFERRRKIVTSQCSLLAALPLPGVSLGYLSLLLWCTWCALLGDAWFRKKAVGLTGMLMASVLAGMKSDRQHMHHLARDQCWEEVRRVSGWL